MEIKVLSWNIWLGRHLPEILNFLQQERPDVIGIQEAESRVGGNQVAEIAEVLGYHWVYFPSVTDAAGSGKGNGIASRFPIASGTCHVLGPAVEDDGTPTTETRTAVEVTVEVNGTSFTFVTTHLGYAPGFAPSSAQDAQVATLEAVVRSRPRLALMGDFNSLPGSQTVQTLSSVLSLAGNDPSAPTWTMYPHEYMDHKETRLKDRIDYMFVSSDLTVREFEIGMSRGSNHLPIWSLLRS